MLEELSRMRESLTLTEEESQVVSVTEIVVNISNTRGKHCILS